MAGAAIEGHGTTGTGVVAAAVGAGIATAGAPYAGVVPTIWAIKCGGTDAAAIAACCIARAVMVSLKACWALADPVVGAGCAKLCKLAPGEIPCMPWTATCMAAAAACWKLAIACIVAPGCIAGTGG